MNILERSDIKLGNSRIYLNNEEQGTNLFFTNNFDEQYYILMREEEVIASGVLKGFGERGNYKYRFDFLNFIKIYNQEIQPHTIIDEYGSYKFEGDNSCSLYFYLSSIDILEDNIFNQKLIVREDGSIWLNREEYTYDDIYSINRAFITFVDAESTDYDTKGYELQYRSETQGVSQRGNYTPVTVYRNNILQYNFLDNNGNILFASENLRKGIESETPGLNDGYILTESDGYLMSEVGDWVALEPGMTPVLSSKIGYVTYMLRIPENASKLIYYVYSRGGESSGNDINLIENSKLIKFNPYSSDTKESVLVEDAYKAVPNAGKAVHIYGGYTSEVIPHKLYSSSLWVKASDDVYAEIYLLGNVAGSKKVHSLYKNQWQYISTKPATNSGNKHFGVKLLSNNISLEYKMAKAELGEPSPWSPHPVELEMGTVHSVDNIAYDGCMTPYYFWNENGAYDSLYCSGVANKIVDVDKEYINVNGRQIPLKITSVNKIKHNTGLALKQEQIYSLIRSPQVNHITTKDGEPHNSIYNIDLESFEGYNGINISDRNIELIFSKPMESKRVTNKKLNFFD